MIVGIISDTHDDVDRTESALDIFKAHRVDIILHLGDWICPFIPRLFRGYKVVGILGNNDGDVVALRRAAEDVGIDLRGDFAVVEIDGKKVAMIHGQYTPLVEALVQSQIYDFVLYGHTHEKVDMMNGKTRILNPGVEYVIIYNTEQNRIEFIKTEGTNSLRLRAR